MLRSSNNFGSQGFFFSSQESVACAASRFIGAFSVLHRVKHQLHIFNFEESVCVIHFPNTSLSSGKLWLISALCHLLFFPFSYESWLQSWLWDSHQNFQLSFSSQESAQFQVTKCMPVLRNSVPRIKYVRSTSTLTHQKVSTAHSSLLLSVCIHSQLKYTSFMQCWSKFFLLETTISWVRASNWPNCFYLSSLWE